VTEIFDTELGYDWLKFDTISIHAGGGRPFDGTLRDWYRAGVSSDGNLMTGMNARPGFPLFDYVSN
jgi:hypothetical protein